MRSRRAVTARRRRLDDDGLAGADLGGIAAPQFLHVAVSPPHAVLSDLTGFAARQTERPHAAVPDKIVHSIFSRNRMVRRMPSPACHRPFPPEALRIGTPQQQQGSGIPSSGSVSRVLVMWVCTASVLVEAGPR